MMTKAATSSGAAGASGKAAMFLRFVHLKVGEGPVQAVREFYGERIIPALEEAAGCCWAGLLEPTGDPKNDWISMTLWTSRVDAESYEASGMYDRLLDDIDDITGSDKEWRERLHEPFAVGPHPAHDPEIEGHEIDASGVIEAFEGCAGTPFFRVVSVRIDDARLDELRARYQTLVVPALDATPGCRAVLFVEGPAARNRAFSMSIWESEGAALRYEGSGKFDELVGQLSDLFSGLYQWKRSLVDGASHSVLTGSDLDVAGYRVMVGRTLEP